MKELITNQIKELRIIVSKFNAEYKDQIISLKSDLDKIETTAISYKDHWKGEWYENNYNLFTDLSGSTSEIHQYSKDEIKVIFSNESKVNFDKIDQEVKSILSKQKLINDEILTELSIIKDDDSYENQISLLNKLENYKWGYPFSKWINNIRPKTGNFSFQQLSQVTGDSFTIPPHVYFLTESFVLSSICTSMIEYSSIPLRLFRELELKVGNNQESKKNGIELLDILTNKFHAVATQLRNRHSNRETIIIKDEYDVQDLFHALLKINFKDIRAEEYSPSYAGKNTRVDFLLKDEKIMVEVKKTRDSLKDKGIGNELILDIARYRNHMDCETLYCFVYDPQSLIINPRGLENDLSLQSDNEMNVVVKIVP